MTLIIFHHLIQFLSELSFPLLNVAHCYHCCCCWCVCVCPIIACWLKLTTCKFYLIWIFFFVYFISDNMKLYFFPSACPSIKQCPSTFSTYRNSLFKRCSKFYFPLRCYFVLASFCREKNLVTMGIADYMCVYVRACACMCACVSHWCKYNVDVYAFILLQIQWIYSNVGFYCCLKGLLSS